MGRKLKYNTSESRWELLAEDGSVISYAVGSVNDNPWELTGDDAWKQPNEVTITAGGTVDATAVSSDIITGATAYARGRRITGTLAEAVVVEGDTTTTISPGYLKHTVVVDTTNIPDGYAYVSNVTAKKADVRNTVKFVDDSGELDYGDMADANFVLTDNVFTVTKGFTNGVEMEVPEADAPTVNGNEVTIHKGYNATEQTITVDISSGGGGSGDSSTVYGYLDDNGKFQALDLTGDTPADSGTAEDFTELVMYQTGVNEPEYTSGSSSPVYYKCVIDASGDTSGGNGSADTFGDNDIYISNVRYWSELNSEGQYNDNLTAIMTGVWVLTDDTPDARIWSKDTNGKHVEIREEYDPTAVDMGDPPYEYHVYIDNVSMFVSEYSANLHEPATPDTLGTVSFYWEKYTEEMYFMQFDTAHASTTGSVATVSDIPSTWSGYAIRFDGHTWYTTATLVEGLEIKGLTPVVGGVYSADTTVKVEELFKDISSIKLTFPDEEYSKYTGVYTVDEESEDFRAVGSNGIITGVVMPEGGTRYTLDSTLTADVPANVEGGLKITDLSDATWTNSNGDTVNAIYEELHGQASEVLPPEEDDSSSSSSIPDIPAGSGAVRIQMKVILNGVTYNVSMDPYSTDATGQNRRWSGTDEGGQEWTIYADYDREWWMAQQRTPNMIGTNEPAANSDPWSATWSVGDVAVMQVVSMTPTAIV